MTGSRKLLVQLHASDAVLRRDDMTCRNSWTDEAVVEALVKRAMAEAERALARGGEPTEAEANEGSGAPPETD